MDIVFTPSVCHIDLGAIRRNFLRLGPPDQLMPVIKSDAYGHGLPEVANTLDQAGALRFAVGLADEGAALRKLGHTQEIVLLMGCLEPCDWEIALRCKLTPIVGGFDDLRAARDLLARHPGRTLSVAIKADTGMSRLGFDLSQIGEAGDFIANTKGLEPKFLLSHLACADMPEADGYTQTQLSRFDEFHAALAPAFPRITLSLGNSAGAITGRSHDIGRPGVAIYGVNPMPGKDDIGLEQAMSVSTPVIAIRKLAPGQSVSYGRLFTARKTMTIAIVACGYASGFNRNLSGRVQALLHGRRVNQIGRVCMSMACLDITGMENIVKIGDSAWIMGGEGENPVTAAEIASLLDTIPYEIFCIMGKLNPRVYRKG